MNKAQKYRLAVMILMVSFFYVCFAGMTAAGVGNAGGSKSSAEDIKWFIIWLVPILSSIYAFSLIIKTARQKEEENKDKS